MGSIVITAAQHAGEWNHPDILTCEDASRPGGCDQAASVVWHDGTGEDAPLCAQHAGEWLADAADPGSDNFVGRRP
jgi:hypothetical protein